MMKREKIVHIAILLAVVLLLGSVAFASLASYQQFRADADRSGQQLVSLLSKMDAERLAQKASASRFLSPLFTDSATLAYVELYDEAGVKQHHWSQGVVPPQVTLPTMSPAQWFGQQSVSGRDARSIDLFYGPLLREGQLSGFVSVGVQADGYAFITTQWLNLFVMALPIVLLLLLGAFVWFSNASAKVRQGYFALAANASSGQLSTTGKSGKANAAATLQAMQQKLVQIRQEKTSIYTSAKLLAYQKSNSEAMLRSIPQGVLVLDEAGYVIFANQPFLHWLQVDASEVVGHLPNQWCHQEAIAQFLSRFKGHPAKRPESGGFAESLPGKPDASISLMAYPMFSAEDAARLNRTLVVFSDMTAEIAARRARDEFAAALSHELKTPLHAIGMYAEVLMGEDGEDEAYRIEAANFINSEVEHVNELVKNMLNITRIETGSLTINRKMTKLNDLLDSVISNLQNTADENNIQIVPDYPEGMKPCYLDKDLLRVALNNLITNGIKYNRINGEVKVTVDDHDHELSITVADSGIGIKEEELPQVFDKFYRSEDEDARERPGHGLGLSLVKEIVELHSGQVLVESVKNVGTQFTIKMKKINVPLKEAA